MARDGAHCPSRGGIPLVGRIFDVNWAEANRPDAAACTGPRAPARGVRSCCAGWGFGGLKVGRCLMRRRSATSMPTFSPRVNYKPWHPPLHLATTTTLHHHTTTPHSALAASMGRAACHCCASKRAYVRQEAHVVSPITPLLASSPLPAPPFHHHHHHQHPFPLPSPLLTPLLPTPA